MEVQLGGWMPTHQGLRHLPVNARALNYQCVLFSIASEAGQPLIVSDADAAEFAKMTRGIECYIEVPDYIHPALPEIANRSAHRAHFYRLLKVARVLRARAVVMECPRRWANGRMTSMEEIENRMVDFFSIDFEEDAPLVYFRMKAAGLGSPSILDRVIARLDAGRFFYSFDPTTWNPGGETVSDRQLEAILGYWAKRTRLVQFSRLTEEEQGAARRLAGRFPVVLTMRSLAEQAEASEAIRALAEEVDIFKGL